MSNNVSTSHFYPTVDLPTVEEIRRWNRDKVRRFLQGKKNELNLQGSIIDKMYDNGVNGKVFLALTQIDLQSFGLLPESAKSVENLTRKIYRGMYV
jgi:hypothetical protein